MPKYRVWDEYMTAHRWERIIEAPDKDEAWRLFEAWKNNEGSEEPSVEIYVEGGEGNGVEEVE